jgi:hypothetical protein
MMILAVLGIILVFNIGWVVYLFGRTPRLNQPLTVLEKLKAAPPFPASVARKPRLTANGKVLMFIAVSFGLMAALVSSALFWRIASVGITPTAIAAMGMVAVVDLVPIGFAVLLRSTYRLLRTGHFATGIVVAAKVGGVKTWDVFYDFLDGSDQVVRGSSRRSFYTVALARAFHRDIGGDYFGVGSYVPVLYRPDKPTQGVLYVSFPWAL